MRVTQIADLPSDAVRHLVLKMLEGPSQDCSAALSHGDLLSTTTRKAAYPVKRITR
jgi:hypothetical protein